MNGWACGWGRRCRQTHPYANIRSNERQVRFNAFDWFSHWRRNGWDREGVRDHSIRARIAGRLMVVAEMLIVTMHRMVDLSLRECLNMHSLRFGQSLRAYPNRKRAVRSFGWHPSFGHYAGCQQ